MKRIMIALVAMAVTMAAAAMPTFAAEVSAPNQKMDQKQMMQHPGQHPGMQAMMRNPQHLLAMAYHKNLVHFGMALKKVAQQGETVPKDFARAAVIEMRRSADQMEIKHAEAMRDMPADLKAKQADKIKMMDSHLAEMKTQLAQLDDLTKRDPIDSKEVIKHLQFIFKACDGMKGAGMHHEGMHGKGMHGEGCEGMQGKGMHCEDCQGNHGKGCQEMHGKDMDCVCQHCKKMHREGKEGWQDAVQQRKKMMAEMKAQDAEIAKLVDKMNSAPKDQKQEIMADILTRMVRQRAAMSAHMAQMQQHMRHHMDGAAMPSGPTMEGRDGHDADAEDSDMDDSDSDDSDSHDMNMKDMDMKGMHMQDTGK